MKEIERKYLMDSRIIRFLHEDSLNYTPITQYYTQATPAKSVRYRRAGNSYYFTVKKGVGGIRKEREKSITKKEYKAHRKERIGQAVKKVRFVTQIKDISYVVDIYREALRGLYVMEVEFSDRESYEVFELPESLRPFVIREVTDDEMYKNKNLALFGPPHQHESVRLPARGVEELMQIFRELIEEIRPALEQEGLGEEALHKLRIGLRKSVALIDVFEMLFAPGTLRPYRKKLKAIISATNRKRDMDVLGIRLRDELKKAKSSKAASLGELAETIEAEADKEYAEASDKLHSETAHETLEEWEAFVTDGYRDQTSYCASYPMDSLLGYAVLAQCGRIAKQTIQVRMHPKVIKELHKLRIMFKRLRYLMEVAIDRDPQPKKERLFRELKVIQDLLGEINDRTQERALLDALDSDRKQNSLHKKLLHRSRKKQKRQIAKLRKPLDRFVARQKSYRKLFNPPGANH